MTNEQIADAFVKTAATLETAVKMIHSHEAAIAELKRQVEELAAKPVKRPRAKRLYKSSRR